MPSLFNDDECLVNVFFGVRLQNCFDLLMDGIQCGRKNAQVYDAGTGSLNKYQASVIPVARNQYPALFPRYAEQIDIRSAGATRF